MQDVFTSRAALQAREKAILDCEQLKDNLIFQIARSKEKLQEMETNLKFAIEEKLKIKGKSKLILEELDKEHASVEVSLFKTNRELMQVENNTLMQVEDEYA